MVLCLLLKRAALTRWLCFSWLLLVPAACSFDRIFLAPDPLPVGINEITLYNPKDRDTTLVVYGLHFQPTFLRHGRDTLKIPFLLESIVFSSSNGNLLNGWVMKPRDAPVKATIIFLHGNAGNLLSQFQLIRPLVQQGFQIFLFDYSGFGFSTGRATRKNVLTDALAAVTYVQSRPDLVAVPLVLYGQSLGGHLAAVVAAARPAAFRAVVLEGAFSSHRDIAAYTVRHIIGLGVLGRILVKERYSAKEAVTKIKLPLLVIHSTEDKIIPFTMGQRLYAKALGSKQFYAIRKAHILGPMNYADSIAQRIYRLLP